jgi:hypothetical protein
MVSIVDCGMNLMILLIEVEIVILDGRLVDVPKGQLICFHLVGIKIFWPLDLGGLLLSLWSKHAQV